MNFRDFLEADGMGSRASFVRGGTPHAAADLPPPIQYGVSAADHHASMVNWEMSVFQFIIHLDQSGRMLQIGDRKYLPENDLKTLHIEAIHLLQHAGILSKTPLEPPLTTNEVKIPELEQAIAQGSFAGQAETQQVAEAILDMYRNREVVNYTKVWGMGQTYHVPQELLKQRVSPAVAAAGMGVLRKSGILGEDEPLYVYEVSVGAAIQAVRNKHFINVFFKQPLQTAINAAMKGKFELSPHVQDTY